MTEPDTRMPLFGPGGKIPNWMLGGVIASAGAAMMYIASRFILGDAGEWLSMAGIIAIVLGGIVGFSTGSPWETLRSLTIAIAIALVVRWAVFEPFRIPSGSMETTLHGDPNAFLGDRVFVNKWVYGVRVPFLNKRLWHGEDPQRWDIVVFKSVEEDPRHSTLVKRIVGMPGERIQIRDGKVYVNGEALPIPDALPEDTYYTTAGDYGVASSDEYALVPEGHYLLLGDNSRDSRDGRFFGFVPNENLLGRVSAIGWPIWRWRDFTGFSQSWWWRLLVASTVLALLVRIFIGRTISIPHAGGERYKHAFVNQLAYGFRVPLTHLWLTHWRAPRRGDPVLYQPDKNDTVPRDTLLFGRIAGLPGERVTLEEGRILINGAPLEGVPALSDATWSAGGDTRFGQGKNKQYTVVPEGRYFILSGDAASGRRASPDGRTLGWTPRERIRGRVQFNFWPPRTWGGRV